MVIDIFFEPFLTKTMLENKIVIRFPLIITLGLRNKAIKGLFRASLNGESS